MPKQITVESIAREPSPRDGQLGVKDQEGKWWNFPPDKVNFRRGAVVVIEGASGPRKNNVTRFSVKSAGGGGYGGGSGGGAPRSGGGGGADYSEVNWNASVARAVEVVDLLLKHDAVALGPKTAKPADRQAVILDLVDEITARLFVDIKERKPLKKAKEVAGDLGEGDGVEGLGDDDFGEDDDI